MDCCLSRLWQHGLIFRTKKPSFVFETVNRGRSGVSGHTRAINHYALNDGKSLTADFVKFEDRLKDGRNNQVENKAVRVLSFLQEHADQAYYSRDIVDILKVKTCDIMANVRRFEKKGLVYVRGYQSHDRRSPFSKGYILTYINQTLQRDQAIKEAFDRTSKIITDKPTSNTIHERIKLIRDQLLTSNQILSQNYLKEILDCPPDTFRQALKRAMQLYPDIKEVKIFGNFAYYYLASMTPENLAANIELKKNYIRIRYGKENRIGHNWEACVEWFIDKFTEGAEFLKQNHRQRMDPKRITIHLLKPVGDRKQAGEIDRVWKVTPGLFSPTVTYVLKNASGA